MKLKYAALTLAISLGLIACSSSHRANLDFDHAKGTIPHPAMTKKQCMKMNMFRQGQRDGLEGRSINTFYEFYQSCHTHHVRLLNKNYNRGWKQGNRKYCSANHYETLPEVCSHNKNAQQPHEKVKGHHQNFKPQSNAVAPKTHKTPKLSELQTQLQDILDSKAQINTDLDFFRDGVVHDQRSAQLQDLNAREKSLRAEIRALKQAALIQTAVNNV